MQTIKVKHASVAIVGAEACSFLQGLIASQEQEEGSSTFVDLELCSAADGLHLTWFQAEDKSLRFHLDFEKVAKQLRSFPAPKQGAFNQALGKKSKCIIDATGGWGGDALLMCLQGYRVSIVERLPIMAILIEDAFSRLGRSAWAQDNGLEMPEVNCQDALTVLSDLKLTADCVYMDPMFPPKKKKSASANKYMQLLKWLAGPDLDAEKVAQAALANYPRVAVKRPDHAQPIIPSPQTQFSSKLVHYDVYLNPSALS